MPTMSESAAGSLSPAERAARRRQHRWRRSCRRRRERHLHVGDARAEPGDVGRGHERRRARRLQVVDAQVDGRKPGELAQLRLEIGLGVGPTILSRMATPAMESSTAAVTPPCSTLSLVLPSMKSCLAICTWARRPPPELETERPAEGDLLLEDVAQRVLEFRPVEHPWFRTCRDPARTARGLAAAHERPPRPRVFASSFRSWRTCRSIWPSASQPATFMARAAPASSGQSGAAPDAPARRRP